MEEFGELRIGCVCGDEASVQATAAVAAAVKAVVAAAINARKTFDRDLFEKRFVLREVRPCFNPFITTAKVTRLHVVSPRQMVRIYEGGLNTCKQER